VLDALGAKYLVLPDQSLYGGMEQIGPAAGREVADAVLLRNPTAFPRAWIVHHVETLPPIGGDDPAAVERRTRRVLFPDGRPRDLRTAAVVESDLAWDVQAARPGGGDSCRIVSDQPQRVELEVALTAPGLVVLSDTYDPDWTARVAGQGDDRGHPAPVLRTNRVMRGIPLPAGRHRVVYQYRPRSFLAALALSALGWTAMLTAWIVAQTRTLRVRRAEDR
jgi:hypothetical protein